MKIRFNLSAVPGGNTCSVCHTPHSAVSGTPLWNHKLSEAVYNIYQSSSLEANVGQPAGYSKLCLNCHDGLVAQTYLKTNLSKLSSHDVTKYQEIHDPRESLTLSIMQHIECVDCHSSDSSSAAKEPHGSIYQNLLTYHHETSDFTQESSFSYELCYKCHSRNSILNDESVTKHKENNENKNINKNLSRDFCNWWWFGVFHIPDDAIFLVILLFGR